MPSITLTWPDRTYFYSLLVVSLLSAKLLHVFSHLTTIPIFLFLLYLPTFFFLDFLVIFFTRIIFQKWRVPGIFISLLIASTSATQIGFFIETGGEIHWNMLAKVLREPEGFFGMLMSGFYGLSLTIGILGGIAWLFNPLLYNLSHRMVRTIVTTIFPSKRTVFREGLARRRAPDQEDGEGLLSESVAEKAPLSNTVGAIRWARLKLLAVAGTIIVLHIVRPLSPYQHMSGTLPFTLFEGLWVRRSVFCEPSPYDGPPEFPFPELLRKEFWIPAEGAEDGVGRGWRPGSPWWEVAEERAKNRPSWLLESKIPGFERFYGHRHHGPPGFGHHEGSPGHGHHHPHGHHEDDFPPPPPPPPGYEPILDPLKITNLDLPIMDALKDALSTVSIKHVIILSLESTRKDVFPLIKDGILYNKIMESRGYPTNSKRDVSKSEPWADLSQLSRMAEDITGEDGGFGGSVNSTFGGINIKGALTGSSFTLKSLLGSHCGVSPLAVDFMEELETDIYQPCLAHILKAMNVNLPKAGTVEKGWRNNGTWKSVFMQASTTKFDRQAPFIGQIGFDGSVVRETLQSPDAKYKPKQAELNYFGYSETELKPYIKDLFVEAEATGDRVFLSHLTSSTHHPWATPPEFGEQEPYWGVEGSHASGGGSAWNKYLNSIKWGDSWISEVLGVLEEVGVANETLVVMVGDHGFAFGESTNAKTTYVNPHIKNFEVPLVFRHPQLPRIQLNFTTTSMTILPTVLDLLISTNSLNDESTAIAKYMLPEYEGQSLIRPFRPIRFGRQQWNFGVVNPGGTHLSVVSSAHPYRLVLPICEPSPYTFSWPERDPMEMDTSQSWEGGQKLKDSVESKWGEDAAKWVEEAEKIGGWAIWEGRRRWGYDGGTRREDRSAEHNKDGLLEHDHWWNT
ncbi:sulfatase domain-containing protein [Morchella snyderi]|nr:sulfatase domain-containing protein [Morchella snyderi]